MKNEGFIGSDGCDDLQREEGRRRRLRFVLKLDKEVKENLRPGGPEVDYASLHLYVAGDLSDKQARATRGLIVTYENWNRAYFETLQALDQEKE